MSEQTIDREIARLRSKLDEAVRKQVVQIPRGLNKNKSLLTHTLWNSIKRPDLIILDDMEENMAENKPFDGMAGATITYTGADFGVMGTGPNYRTVKIDKVANGFVIEIGCKKFVAENWEMLAKKLGEYWKDPVAAEKKYCK